MCSGPIIQPPSVSESQSPWAGDLLQPSRRHAPLHHRKRETWIYTGARDAHAAALGRRLMLPQNRRKSSPSVRSCVIRLDEPDKLGLLLTRAALRFGLVEVAPHPEGPFLKLCGACAGFRGAGGQSLRRDWEQHLALVQARPERDLADAHTALMRTPRDSRTGKKHKPDQSQLAKRHR